MSGVNPSYLLSPSANADIQQILDWTTEQFGADASFRYQLLLRQAILDVAADTMRAGSYPIRTRTALMRAYHLRNSRKQVRAAKFRVRKPRHVIVYRVDQAGAVEIVRVLHDRMNPSRWTK